MWNNVSEFEVRIKGHSLVQVNNGEVKINGKDFHSDIKNLSALVEILSDVLGAAQEAKKPRLVTSSVKPKIISRKDGPFPYKVVGH